MCNVVVCIKRTFVGGCACGCVSMCVCASVRASPDPVLMALQLAERTLAQVSGHVAVGLGPDGVVPLRGGQGLDQLLRGPLPVLTGQPGREGAGRQGVGQLQRTHPHSHLGRGHRSSRTRHIYWENHSTAQHTGNSMKDLLMLFNNAPVIIIIIVILFHIVPFLIPKVSTKM